MEKWVISAKRGDFNEIGRRFGIDPVVARLIRNRDVTDDASIEKYLYGDVSSLYDPFLMKDMEQAVTILENKIKEKKKIRIIGDYDIDGICSTYILFQGLRDLGAVVDIEIPDRIKDGYGINIALIDAALKAGIDTILTCDNGISAAEQIVHGKEAGMTVIVTDHHEVLYEEQDGKIRYLIPHADAVVNPKQADCSYPFQGLCGAGVAFQLIRAMYQRQGKEQEVWEYLPFAAIATVGDVMDLVDENRILVKEGLKMLEGTSHVGLQALLAVNQLENRPITAYHIGFVLGPCMNASGRLSTAKRAFSLLCSTSRAEADVLANDLKALNDSRKEMTEQGTQEAITLVETTSLKQDKVLVVYLPDCHESLAGIIAGRIREKYGRPAFVLTKGEEAVKGSGRSIEAYSMYREMTRCKDLFLRFGGHPMAAGLSIPEARVGEFRERINALCTLTDEDLIEKIVIDVAMPLSYITIPLVRQIQCLEPFGKGNKKPVFAQRKIRLMGLRILGKNRNVVKMQAFDENGYGMEALYFGEGEAFVKQVEEKETWDILYYPEVNSYQGRENLQIILQKIR